MLFQLLHCGQREPDLGEIGQYFAGIFSIQPGPLLLDEAMKKCNARKIWQKPHRLSRCFMKKSQERIMVMVEEMDLSNRAFFNGHFFHIRLK